MGTNAKPTGESVLPGGRGGGVWLILVAVVLIEGVWCLDYHEDRWHTLIARGYGPKVDAGEGLVIQWNGLGYYAWLRSLLVDGDWAFDNEFDEHNPLHHYVPPPTYQTPLSRRANQWSVGPACLWAPMVVPGHLALRAWQGRGSPWAADGYSLPYQVLVGATSFLIAVAGLGFLYGTCRQFARPGMAALAAAWLTVGTSLFYYNAVEVSQPHGPGTAVMACLVWYWLRSYGSQRPGRWFLVGVLVGLAALMRWQLVTFAVLPALEVILNFVRRRLSVSGPALAVAGAALAFAPQLLAWRCVYGSWLASPIQQVHYHWLTPSLGEIFFSVDRGLFYWTPLALLAFVGFLVGLVRVAPVVQSDAPKRVSRESLVVLLVAFVIQVYVLGSMWGKGEFLSYTLGFA